MQYLSPRGPKQAEKNFSSTGGKRIFETAAIHVLRNSGHIKREGFTSLDCRTKTGTLMKGINVQGREKKRVVQVTEREAEKKGEKAGGKLEKIMWKEVKSVKKDKV